ncbi:MAG: SH3 domain-containing protein [Leptospiraceae bacterium]|nr:SH3 domain-containing protein [Leptospiraceae bacterium]MCB1199861.1 SH3 domain-containing protein [Leptospiraceae bacterium]
MARLRQIFILTLPVLFFIFAVWLIFKRVQSGHTEELETLLREKNFKALSEEVIRRLESEDMNRPRLLMYGSIATLVDPTLPDFLVILQKEDSTQIFLREVFIRLVNLQGESGRLLIWLQRYLELQNSTALEPGSLDFWLSAIEKDSKLELQSIPDFPNFIHRLTKIWPSLAFETTGKDVQIRETPGLTGLVQAKLAKGQIVFCRLKGPEEEIFGKRGSWRYCITEDRIQGWLFDSYLKNKGEK